jgi:hypothetical protein
MGTLADIYSYGDTLKRKVGGLLNDPRGTLEQFVGQLGDDTNTNITNMQTGYGFGGNQSALTTPEQKAAARSALADYGAQSGIAGMFVGKGSRTWDAISAKKAEELTAKGVDPRAVWSETGTWKGPDGHWRQEIPDNMAKSRDYQLTPSKAFSQARFTAAIEDNQLLRDRAESMLPYWKKSKTELQDEFASTGGAIVDAALSGDKAKAMQLQKDRGGLSAMLEEMSSAKSGPASSFMKHGDLGAAYPDVYSLHTRIDKDALGANAKAHYNPGDARQGEQMVIGEKPVFKSGQSSMIHEMQHAIQQREGFALGGNTESMQAVLTDLAESKYKDMRKFNDLAYSGDPLNLSDLRRPGMREKSLKAGKEAQDYRTAAGRLEQFPELSFDAYKKLAGEAEARATQARIPLDAAQRRAKFPLDSYDVPVDQLIIRGLLE